MEKIILQNKHVLHPPHRLGTQRYTRHLGLLPKFQDFSLVRFSKDPITFRNNNPNKWKFKNLNNSREQHSKRGKKNIKRIETKPCFKCGGKSYWIRRSLLHCHRGINSRNNYYLGNRIQMWRGRRLRLKPLLTSKRAKEKCWHKSRWWNNSERSSLKQMIWIFWIKFNHLN